MSDPTIGWGAFTSGNVSTIAVTRDGGNRWTPVAIPARCHSAALPFRVTGQTADFIGSTARDDLDSRSSVTWCRTSDLGRTWSVISRFDVHGGPDHPHFVDSRHGWLVAATSGGMHSAGNTYLYRTSDAGLTWQEVAARVVTTLPGFGTSFGDLPVGCRLQFSFVTVLTAWATAGCGNGGAGVDSNGITRYVAVTSDGGHLWRPVTLPRRTFTGGRTGCLVGAACGVEALVTAGNRVVLFVGGVEAVGALYVSADAGHTWAIHELPDPHASVTVRNHTFYASHPNGVTQWSSTDDGRTWQLRNPAVTLGDPESIRYVTSRIGFRMAQMVNGAQPFQRTIDAGRHWQTLHPELVSQ